MPRPIEYLDEARTDFDKSFDWYARQSSRAALRFVAAVDEAIEDILADPDRFPATFRGCRYRSLKRFPFRVVFRSTPDRLVIVAVAHAKRRPDYWVHRN